MKTCEKCGRTFEPKRKPSFTKPARFCSVYCSRKWNGQKQKFIGKPYRDYTDSLIARGIIVRED